MALDNLIDCGIRLFLDCILVGYLLFFACLLIVSCVLSCFVSFLSLCRLSLLSTLFPLVLMFEHV